MAKIKVTVKVKVTSLFYSVPDRTKIILIQDSMRFVVVVVVVVVDRWILQKTL